MSHAPDLSAVVRRHMPVMDGWRGIAILVVVLHNAGAILYGGTSLPVALLHVVLTSGWVGVQLFFVLSGFLITGILLDSRGSPDYFRGFYIRRTLRIFPLYYGFLALALLAGPFLVQSETWVETIRSDGVWYWLYLSNWSPLLENGIDGLQHLWSLAVEEQFYLVWPALVLLTGRRFPLAALGIVIAAPLSRVAMYAADLDPDYLYHFTIARADAFAVGALMALAARDTRWTATVLGLRRHIFVTSSIGLVAVVVASSGFGQYAPAVLLAGQSLISFWFGLLMFVTLAPQSSGERALARGVDTGWLRFFGKYSYAIYVLHFPLHAFFRGRMAGAVDAAGPVGQLVMTTAYATAVLGGSTLLAIASWHLYEKHFLALKQRWAPRAAA